MLKPSGSKWVLSTVLSLVIVLAPFTATAQAVGEVYVAQPPTDATESAQTAIDLSERPNASESLQQTLQLLKTPGWHPELVEIFGLDEWSEARSLPAPSPPALSTGGKVAIIVAVAVAVIVIVAVCAVNANETGSCF